MLKSAIISNNSKSFFNRISKFIYSIRTNVSTSVHQETETAEGGGWFSSGDHYKITITSKKIYIFGIPIYTLYYNSTSEIYYFEM